MTTGTGNPGDLPHKTENTGPKTDKPVQNAGGNPGNGLNHPPEVVVNAVDDVTDKAHDVVDRAAEGLKQTSANATMQVHQAQQAMLDRAYDVKTKATNQLYQAAETLRSEVRTGQGQPVQQAEALAANLEQLGKYLEANSFDEIESDVRHSIQRNPWQSVGIAVAIGWVLSRIFAPRR